MATGILIGLILGIVIGLLGPVGIGKLVDMIKGA